MTDATRDAARDRVARTWARYLADRHPGHTFVVQWRERPDTTTARDTGPREIPRHVLDEQHGRTAA